MDGIRTRVPLFWRELYFWGHRYGPFYERKKIFKKIYERLVQGSDFGPFAFGDDLLTMGPLLWSLL